MNDWERDIDWEIRRDQYNAEVVRIAKKWAKAKAEDDPQKDDYRDLLIKMKKEFWNFLTGRSDSTSQD